jgi:hypothetical protein
MTQKHFTSGPAVNAENLDPVIAEETGEQCEYDAKKEEYLPATFEPVHVHYDTVFFDIKIEGAVVPFHFKMRPGEFIDWLEMSEKVISVAADYYSRDALTSLMSRLMGGGLLDIFGLSTTSEDPENTPIQASAVLGTNPDEEKSDEDNSNEQVHGDI